MTLRPIPKVGHPAEIIDYRLVALTSHIMKTYVKLAYRNQEWIMQSSICTTNPLTSRCTGWICENYFYGLLKHIWHNLPLMLQYKLDDIGDDADTNAQITKYLTVRIQFVKLGNCLSETIKSNTVSPQGMVWAPSLTTVYTAVSDPHG